MTKKEKEELEELKAELERLKKENATLSRCLLAEQKSNRQLNDRILLTELN